MSITYGGQELVQPSAAVLEWAERMLDVGGPWDTPPHIPRGGAALQRLPHVQNAPTDEPGVNILCWPRGASRYAYGHFIIHETQLAIVRAEAYAGSSYNALQFIFSDGIRSVSPYLYMLPPRPIVAPDAGEFLPGLYLITLVDHRYFWHYKGAAGTALDTTTWSSLYSSIGTALGVTITADSVHSEYSVPPDSFAIGYQSLPALLDACAASCGHVIVRTLEGDVLAMNADTSGVRLTDNVTATALTVRLAGGIIGFDTSDRASVIPSSVTVCFGRLGEAGEPYAKEVTLASLSLINYSTTIPFVGTKILYHPTRADYSADPPTNQADLDLIANRMAIDWYKFRFGRYEARLEGAIAWPMEGHTDRVYFDHSREAITTCGVTTRLAIAPWLEPTSDCGEDPTASAAPSFTEIAESLTDPSYQTDDYDGPTRADLIRLDVSLTSSPDYLYTITGMEAGYDGQQFALYGSFLHTYYRLRLKHDSGDSLAANRFYLPLEQDYIFSDRETVWFYYSGDLDRWILFQRPNNTYAEWTSTGFTYTNQTYDTNLTLVKPAEGIYYDTDPSFVLPNAVRLRLHEASPTQVGTMTTGTQSFVGNKTFANLEATVFSAGTNAGASALYAAYSGGSQYAGANYDNADWKSTGTFYLGSIGSPAGLLENYTESIFGVSYRGVGVRNWHGTDFQTARLYQDSTGTNNRFHLQQWSYTTPGVAPTETSTDIAFAVSRPPTTGGTPSMRLGVDVNDGTTRIFAGGILVNGSIPGAMISGGVPVTWASITGIPANITALEVLTDTANNVPMFNGAGMSLLPITAAAQSILDDTTTAAIATTLGLGTGNSPEFAGINVGHATDTTITRTGAGDIAVEGNLVYRAGGTPVPVADGGTGSSTAAGAATNLELGTGDSPQFTGINVGHATDTTVTRSSAGDIAVEGFRVFRVGGADVPVDDGGTGRSSATAYAVICGGTTSTSAHQSVASVGTSGQVLTSNGAGALPTFQAAGLGSLNLTGANPELADKIAGYDVSGTANASFLASYLLALIPGEPGGRLTPVTGNPFGTATSTTLYYTAFKHNIIVLWDGTRWIANQFTELSMSVAGFGGAIPYDIFCYLSGGTPTLEGEAWASKTARTTGVTIQDGRYCKTGDKQRLYLGTVYNYSGNVVVSTGANSQIGIWNMYHRTRHAVHCVDVTDSWTYTTASWRQTRASTTNQFEYVCGFATDCVTATATCHCVNSGSDMQIGPGIGVNSTSVNSAIIRGGTSESGKSQSAWAQWTGIGNAGFNYVAWLEQSTATTGTTTFYGDAGGIATLQTGMVGEVWA